MDKILVVIPVINLWDDFTIHAMESIAANKCDVHFDVLIVDQNSTDQTVEKALDFDQRKFQQRVLVKHNDKNTGCAGGWNQGVKHALENGYSHIIIANNDILCGPNMIQALYNRMKRDPKVLLCSAIDVIKEIPIPQLVLNAEHEINKKEDTEAPHPNFSCFMITPETIETVGWFEEGFFPAYFEDNDYHYRLKLAAGESSAIATTAAVFCHYGSRTQNQNVGSPIVPGELFRMNELFFINKWGGVPGREQYLLPYNNKNSNIKDAKHTG